MSKCSIHFITKGSTCTISHVQNKLFNMGVDWSEIVRFMEYLLRFINAHTGIACLLCMAEMSVYFSHKSTFNSKFMPILIALNTLLSLGKNKFVVVPLRWNFQQFGSVGQKSTALGCIYHITSWKGEKLPNLRKLWSLFLKWVGPWEQCNNFWPYLDQLSQALHDQHFLVSKDF